VVKGMTKKQLLMLIEKNIRNDNACITEQDMYFLFTDAADIYDAQWFHGEAIYELQYPNPYWEEIRMFLPRVGDVLKGLDKHEPSKADSEEHSQGE